MKQTFSKNEIKIFFSLHNYSNLFFPFIHNRQSKSILYHFIIVNEKNPFQVFKKKPNTFADNTTPL